MTGSYNVVLAEFQVKSANYHMNLAYEPCTMGVTTTVEKTQGFAVRAEWES